MSTAASPSFVVLFERIGPYHFARLSALARQASTVAIEMFGMDSTYAWEKVSDKSNFERITLLPKAGECPNEDQILAARVDETLTRLRPACVAVPGWSEKAALAALAWCRRTGTPAVVMSASTALDERRVWWKETLKGWIVRMCSAGLGGGTRHVEYLQKLGLPAQNLFPGYDVVDNAFFSSRAAAARSNAAELRVKHGLPEKYLLASNRFVEKKNLPRLLQAYADYRRKAGPAAWKLVLLGDGPLKKQVLALREELGLMDDLLLPGFKQYSDLPIYYGLAQAFVQASTAEQWGLVVNEAMASGLPVLVSDRCGCSVDLVEHGRNGFTFDPTNVPALSELFLHCHRNEMQLPALGEASLQIISRWSPETFAQNLEKAAASVHEKKLKPSWLDLLLLNLLLRR